MTLPTIIPASAAVESDELVLLLVVGLTVGAVGDAYYKRIRVDDSYYSLQYLMVML
jgi:hypothetical protein